MRRALCNLLKILIVYSVVGLPFHSHAQDTKKVFSIIASWKTEGSIDLLARNAAAFKKLKHEDTVAICFGSLLGPSRIVEFDEGARYCAAAREAGFDYIIPSASEFMFGLEVFESYLASELTPRFISANLVEERTGSYLLSPYIVRNLDGLRVCIIPMSDPNTLKNASDTHVQGVDILSVEDAMKRLVNDIINENPDMVFVVGWLDRKVMVNIAARYPFVDAYLTNNKAGGFSGASGVTAVVSIGGKPVYVCSESNRHLGLLNVTYHNGIESQEFSDVTLNDDYPPDPEVSSDLTKILDKLLKTDYEDSIFVKTGMEVASLFRSIFKVDVVALEKKSMYYFPLRDSLTVLNVRNVIKPGNLLAVFSIDGISLRSIWEQSKKQTFSELRLILSGLSDDGKIDSIPIQDDRIYSILTTNFLMNGGEGYEQFRNGKNVTIQDVDMLATVESFLVAKEERIRRASKPKIWELNLFLTLNSNFNREDVDEDKQIYGSKIPKPFLNMSDKYTGNFIFNSQNNILTVNKTIGKNIFENYLKFSYSRQGTKTDKKGGIQYNAQRNHDPVEWYNKYTYNIPRVPAKPYFDLKINSFLYSGVGKHPITGTVSMGGTRTFQQLLNLNLALGIHGTRDYYELENSFGTNSTVTINKMFPKNILFSKEAALSSKTNFYWNPMAKYNMEFKMDSDNSLRIQIWNKINGTFIFRAYSYRNSIYRKVAVGYYYLFTLDYGMTWKM